MLMTRLARFTATPLLATLLGFALLCLPAPLAAIDFPHYDAMNNEQQTEYLVLMVNTTELAFRAGGHADFADQTEKLFNQVEPGDWMTLGMLELGTMVDRARVADAKRVVQDPQAKRIEVEAALFVMLQKKNMTLTPDERTSVLNTMSGYHWMNLADFEKLPAANQRRIITIDANWGFFDQEVDRMVKDKRAGKQIDPDEEKANLLMERQIVNEEFLSAPQYGIAKAEQQIASAYAQKPDDPGVLYNVCKYILQETDNRITAEIKRMEGSTYHAGDSTTVRPSVWQQLAESLKKQQEASPKPTPSRATVTPPPAAPKKTQEEDDDDPIGEGGFITPPTK
jgi:hypothetical protein